MKEILNDITAKLAAVKSLNYASENWGQLDYFGKECPVQWPCALIDILGGQFSNIGNDYRQTPENRQEGTISVVITVANLRLTNTSGRAPLSQKIAAFEVWDLVEDVHKALHGWKPGETSGALIRTTMSSTKRDDGIQEKKITYSLGIHDC